MESSKSQRLLKQLGVIDTLARGHPIALVGTVYELRKEATTHVRVVFLYDEEKRLCVGYASNATGRWEPVEFEPFSMRALGYYERRLKRIGEVHRD